MGETEAVTTPQRWPKASKTGGDGGCQGAVEVFKQKAAMLRAQSSALGRAHQHALLVVAEQAHQVATLEQAVARCESMMSSLTTNVELATRTLAARL